MKKNLKYILIITVITILLFALCGCNNSKNNTNNTSNKNNNTNSTSNNNTKQQTDIEKIDFVSSAQKQIANPEKGDTIAIIHVKNYGNITVKFFKDSAPKAVENFITLSKQGYYNGVTFHRVINDFMIQGGDPTGTGAGGESMWGKDFEDEFSYDLVPYRGALCMANAGSNTNGSQFFIEQASYDESTYKIYGGSMHLFFAHTVFGQVIDGMDVVDKIAATKTDTNGKPDTDVVIENIEIKEY